MRKFFTFLIAILFSVNIFAQSPQKMTYQAVVRDASNALVVNHLIGIKVSVLQTSTSGIEVYSEILTPTTNANGLLNIEIGSAVGFDLIDWNAGPYFIKTEIDVEGGSNYTITSTSQLLSVPYALHSRTADSLSGGINETDPVFGNHPANSISDNDILNWNNKIDSYTENQNLSNVLSISNSANSQIKDLSEPSDLQDAATKNYVDALKAQIEALQYATGLKVDDADGNVYDAVTIGTQVWMTKDLRSSKYNDQTSIPKVTDNTEWSTLTTAAFCWYNNDSVNYESSYGKLYNFYAVETGKLCPTGWHVASDADWTTLTDFLGGSTVAAGILKETSTEHWLSPNTGATNDFGFSALGAGYRYYSDGVSYELKQYGSWWSSTVDTSTNSWRRRMDYNNTIVGRYSANKKMGFQVRCIKN